MSRPVSALAGLGGTGCPRAPPVTAMQSSYVVLALPQSDSYVTPICQWLSLGVRTTLLRLVSRPYGRGVNAGAATYCRLSATDAHPFLPRHAPSNLSHDSWVRGRGSQ